VSRLGILALLAATAGGVDVGAMPNPNDVRKRDTGGPAEEILKALVRMCHDNSKAKGWWQDQTQPQLTAVPDAVLLDADLVRATIPEKIALMHSELSEALEEYRNGHIVMYTFAVDPKPEGLTVELADTIIRIFDLVGALGVEDDFVNALFAKMDYNTTRSHRHGGKLC